VCYGVVNMAWYIMDGVALLGFACHGWAWLGVAWRDVDGMAWLGFA
jgi:hypothetical protein